MRGKAMNTFINLVLSGDALIDEIDDFIDEWHENTDLDMPLSDFLGLSREEYDLWVERNETLKFILFARRFNLSFSQVLREISNWFDPCKATSENNFPMPVAARNLGSEEEVESIINWLHETGRI